VKMLNVCVTPLRSQDNTFVSSFSKNIESESIAVSSLRNRKLLRGKVDFAVFHWPNSFFYTKSSKQGLRDIAFIFIFFFSKLLFGTQFIWVAHNVRPHEATGRRTLILRLFFWVLDGVVFLSGASKDIVLQEYPCLKSKKFLVIRHGHYGRDLHVAPTPRHDLGHEALKVLFFGLIRPYKNAEQIPTLAKEIPSMQWRIVGRSLDASLADRIKRDANALDNVKVDIRDETIPNADLQAAIDSADIVVLPYKDILNSGAAILALSLNRPVIAPRKGSLPELQADVGSHWLALYDGNLDKDAFLRCVDTLREKDDEASPKLDKYDWEMIGLDLRAFLINFRNIKRTMDLPAEHSTYNS